MNILTELWNNWTIYEKLTTSLTILFIFLLIGLGIRILTKNNSLSLVAMLSNLILGILTILIFWFVNEIFKIAITSEFLIIPTVVLILNILDISTFVTHYTQNYLKKDFNINSLKVEYIKDTIHLTIFVAIFFSVLSAFLKSNLLYISALTGGISLALIWINYYIFYKLVR